MYSNKDIFHFQNYRKLKGVRPIMRIWISIDKYHKTTVIGITRTTLKSILFINCKSLSNLRIYIAFKIVFGIVISWIILYIYHFLVTYVLSVNENGEKLCITCIIVILQLSKYFIFVKGKWIYFRGKMKSHIPFT